MVLKPKLNLSPLFLGGLDLVALNIQRGRDHGLPGYNSYRAVCGSGSGKVRRFEEFGDIIAKEHVQLLKKIYRHVDDVDLYIGGIMERHHGDSIMGPTFKCIVGDGFAR